MDAHTVAEKLTKAQREAVLRILGYLDFQAGEGMGAELPDGRTAWADELVINLADAFEIEWDDLMGSVRNILLNGEDK